MNLHGARDMTAEPAWRGRLRLGLLALALLLGIIVTTIERFRHESILPLWTPANETLGVFTRNVSKTTHGFVERARRVDDLLEADQKLEQAQRELTEARLEQQLMREQLTRLQRLVGSGRWTAPPSLQFVPADVTAIHTQEGSAEVTINRGRLHHVEARDPVVALGGLVGVVRSVGRDHARVQTLSDPGSVVGAVSREGRARGVVRGRGRDKPLEFVTEDESQAIEPGAELVTSGFENSIYPKGVLIGKITDVDLNVYGIPYGVVRPAVTFDTIEEVLLVLPTQRLTGHTDDGTSVTTGSMGRFTITMPGGDLLETKTTKTLQTTGTLSLEAIKAIMQTSPTLMGPPANDASDTTQTIKNQTQSTTQTSAAAQNEKPGAGLAEPTPRETPRSTPKPTPGPTATTQPAEPSQRNQNRRDERRPERTRPRDATTDARDDPQPVPRNEADEEAN